MTTPHALIAAVVQFGPVADAAANRGMITEHVRAAAESGARLIVLPEYANFFEAPLGASMVAAAEELDGAFVTLLGDLADESGAIILAGMAEAIPQGERFANTVVAVVPGLGLIARYRKIHLYDAFGSRESDWVEAGSPGDGAVTLDVEGFRVGIMTCYDLRFPESARTLVDAGADIIAMPAEWVPGPRKEDHWATLVRARAIENTCYVLAADHTPPAGVGCSMIVDPRGVMSAGASSGAGIAVAAVRRSVIDDTRATNPSLQNRRFSVRSR